jgi:hypothetical protein
LERALTSDSEDGSVNAAFEAQTGVSGSVRITTPTKLQIPRFTNHLPANPATCRISNLTLTFGKDNPMAGGVETGTQMNDHKLISYWV